MRFIDADTLIGRFESLANDDWNKKTGTTWANAFEESANMVDDAPTIDAAPVVRCRDCKWYEIYQLKKDGTDDHRYKPSYCTSLGYQTRPDWYCADGKRREDAD